MHAKELLHTLLPDAYDAIDKRLWHTLCEATDTLSWCKQLSIFGLGRSLRSAAKVKHNIKRIDRLLGNKALQAQNEIIYKGIAQALLRGNKRPIIIVDWSGLTRCGAYHFLRAGLAVGGRTLTLYDQSYALKNYMSDKTHCEFLNVLKSLLPEDSRPIIITDAGFRNPWFKAVKRLGWDFIGRVRNKTQYKTANVTVWTPVKTLYKEATAKASALGQALLSKSSALVCYFYLIRQEKKYRVKRNLAGKKIQCSVSKKHEKGAREPWLIASSLSPDEISAADIIRLYKKRMQIEQAFRDLKNARNGFGLRQSRSFQVGRLNMLLLLAALAMLFLWIVGTAAKQQQLHYSFQANTQRQVNVLSNFIIGWQLLIRQEIQFTKSQLLAALKHITLSAKWGHL